MGNVINLPKQTFMLNEVCFAFFFARDIPFHKIGYHVRISNFKLLCIIYKTQQQI